MIDWYFPRTDFALQMLDTLNIGISANIGLFAPRRKGKTAFLLRDLGPTAQDRSYLPVYASLWQDINRPHLGLIAALEQAVAQHAKKGALTSVLAARVRKAAISNELLGRMEIEFADDPQAPAAVDLLRIDQLLGELAAHAGKRRLLLMLDEAQHLATSTQFESLSHALRTSLDKRQGHIKAVFTGSSRHYMDLLFNRSTSSMYNFVDTLRFPDLGEDFLQWLSRKLEKEFGIEVSAKRLEKTFVRFDYSPFWMLRTINRLITSEQNIDDAEEMIHELLMEAEGLPRIVARMPPIDRIVFLAIADGLPPYGESVLQQLQDTRYKPTKSNIQKSIARLKADHLISQSGRGNYETEKPGLANLLRDADSNPG